MPQSRIPVALYPVFSVFKVCKSGSKQPHARVTEFFLEQDAAQYCMAAAFEAVPHDEQHTYHHVSPKFGAEEVNQEPYRLWYGEGKEEAWFYQCTFTPFQVLYTQVDLAKQSQLYRDMVTNFMDNQKDLNDWAIRPGTHSIEALHAPTLNILDFRFPSPATFYLDQVFSPQNSLGNGSTERLLSYTRSVMRLYHHLTNGVEVLHDSSESIHYSLGKVLK